MKPLPLLLSIVLAACVACATPGVPESSEPYAPGLGEIMGQTQVRHAKLFFAGELGNWELAAYEIDELREGLADAVRLHPTHKTVPRPLGELVPGYLGAPLAALDRAVEARDRTAFLEAFDALTAGCNGCHRESEFGFNVVQRPTSPPFTNQDFAPPAPSGR